MHNQYKHLRKNQDGAILVIVMMALTVLSLLGLALATASFANIKLTTVDRDYQATYYVAEGGANQTYAEIKTLVESIYETTSTEASFYSDLNSRIEQQLDDTSVSSFEESFTEQPTAKVKVEQLTEGNPRSYQIVSEGIIGKRTRTVTKPFQVNWKSGSTIEIPENSVAIVKNSISLEGSAALKGDVYVDSSNSGSIVMVGGTEISGVAYVPEGLVNSALNAKKGIADRTTVQESQHIIPWENYKELVNSDIEIPTQIQMQPDILLEGGPAYYLLNLNKDMQFDSITLNSNRVLTINTNNQDHNIVVDNLNMNNGHINIIGSGTVNFYIKDNIVFGASSRINNDGDFKQINLFLKGENKSFNLSGDQRIFGNLIAEDANIDITGSGGFNGYIMTGGNKVVLNGGTYANSFILAPFADIVLTGGAKVYGTIIANKLEGDGGVSATYKTSNLEDFPFGSSNSPSPDDLIKKQPTVESN